jgi:hypothetical protein
LARLSGSAMARTRMITDSHEGQKDQSRDFESHSNER